ncbi:MAG TPA: histone deacetylase [Acidimicrobiales bacterium]|nr:histone deacetylase [Acidimicrobiales bacterium]
MLIVAGPAGACAHDGGTAHPEQQGRIFAAMDGVRALGLEDDLEYIAAPMAEMEDLARVHTTTYLNELRTFCQQGGGDLDPDTFARVDSWTAARRAAGAGLEAVAALERLGAGIAFVPVRPPGHHAEADRAMGFCLLNNVAVSAAALTARGQRVLIVDWDVHHGNGTQAIFWDDPDVLYVSIHQWPLFPGTGTADEVGGPHAVGLTVNVPLPRGATGDVVRRALEENAQPTIDRFAPDWVLVSCGFDAHRADPLGELALSQGDFADLGQLAKTFAPRPGRLVLFLEGGYDPAALRGSVTSTLGALLGVNVPREAPTSGGPGLEAVRGARVARDRAIDTVGMESLNRGGHW